MTGENDYIRMLAEVRSGNRQELGPLVTLVWERLYPFVFRATFDHDTTEDVLQETLLSLVCGVKDLREPSRFWPWIYRIAWSKVQNHVRQCVRQCSAETLLLTSQTSEREARQDRLNPLDAQTEREMAEQVSVAVDELSERHKEILRLHYYDGIPYSEIASKIRTTPSQVRIQSFRAKRSLRARLHACCL